MNKVVSYVRWIYQETRSSLFSVRGLLVVLALIFFNYNALYKLLSYADKYDAKYVPVSMVFIFYKLNFILVFGLITVFLFAEVPYINERTKFVVIRIGRIKWIVGKMFQICITSVIYMLIELLITILLCGRRIELTNRWSALWKTLSISHDGEEIMWVPRNILIKYSPCGALTRVFVIGCLVVCMVGLVMLFISLVCSTLFSVTFTGIIAVLPYVAANTSFYYSKIYYFSPISWIGIIEYSRMYVYGGPDSNDMLLVLLFVIVVFSAINVIIINYIDLIEGKGETV